MVREVIVNKFGVFECNLDNVFPNVCVCVCVGKSLMCATLPYVLSTCRFIYFLFNKINVKIILNVRYFELL